MNRIILTPCVVLFCMVINAAAAASKAGPKVCPQPALPNVTNEYIHLLGGLSVRWVAGQRAPTPMPSAYLRKLAASIERGTSHIDSNMNICNNTGRHAMALGLNH